MKIVNRCEKGSKREVFSLKINLVLWAEITEASSHHVCMAVLHPNPCNFLIIISSVPQLGEIVVFTNVWLCINYFYDGGYYLFYENTHTSLESQDPKHWIWWQNWLQSYTQQV